MKLEALTTNAAVRGILPDASVTVVNVQWHGADALVRLVSEVHRIRLAHLFGSESPAYRAVAPKRRRRVNEAMLPRPPHRFLVADDLGAGKAGNNKWARILIIKLIAPGKRMTSCSA